MNILCPICRTEIQERKWRKEASFGKKDIWCSKCMGWIEPIIIDEGNPRVEAELRKDILKQLKDNEEYWIKKLNGYKEKKKEAKG